MKWFKWIHYLQKLKCVRESTCAPNYDIVFMRKFEKTYIYSYIHSLSNFHYWVIDDMQPFFYISNTFKSNARLKLAKNQAKATKGKLLLFENYSYSSSMLLAKNNRLIIRLTQLIIMKMKAKMKNRSRRYDINRPRSKHAHKYN